MTNFIFWVFAVSAGLSLIAYFVLNAGTLSLLFAGIDFIVMTLCLLIDEIKEIKQILKENK